MSSSILVHAYFLHKCFHWICFKICDVKNTPPITPKYSADRKALSKNFFQNHLKNEKLLLYTPIRRAFREPVSWDFLWKMQKKYNLHLCRFCYRRCAKSTFFIVYRKMSTKKEHPMFSELENMGYSLYSVIKMIICQESAEAFRFPRLRRVVKDLPSF